MFFVRMHRYLLTLSTTDALCLLLSLRNIRENKNIFTKKKLNKLSKKIKINHIQSQHKQTHSNKKYAMSQP